jgi:16S rRNA U516 pseudouridylate synthase RsuA-like enzyme
MIRLQKYLAECGVASRRASEKLIEEGRVTVDGAVVTELGTKIDPDTQKVSCDGKPVSLEKKL